MARVAIWAIAALLVALNVGNLHSSTDLPERAGEHAVLAVGDDLQLAQVEDDATEDLLGNDRDKVSTTCGVADASADQCLLVTQFDYGEDPSGLLPAYRWRDATSVTSDLGFSDLMPQVIDILVTFTFFLAGLCWAVLLFVMRIVFGADLISSALSAVNLGYFKIVELLKSTGIIYIAGLVMLFKFGKSMMGGDVARGARTLAVSLAAFGMILAFQAPIAHDPTLDIDATDLSAAVETPGEVAKGTPGWFAKKGVEITNQVGGMLAGGFLNDNPNPTIGFREASVSPRDLDSDGNPVGAGDRTTCSAYIGALNKTYTDITSQAYQVAPAATHVSRPGETAGSTATASSLRVQEETAPILLSNTLWTRAVYNPWHVAQFGDSSETGYRAGCHQLEASAGKPAREQQLIASVAGYPKPHGALAETPSGELSGIEKVYAAIAEEAGGSWDEENPYFLKGDYEPQSVDCDVLDGVEGNGTRVPSSVLTVTNSNDNPGDGEEAGEQTCTLIAAAENPALNPNLWLYEPGPKNSDKDWKRRIHFWASCQGTNDSSGDEGSHSGKWSISRDYGEGYADSDDCQEAYSQGYLNVLGANDDPFKSAPGGSGPAATQGNAINGKNTGERLISSVLVAIAAFMYLWALGGMAIGVLVAQFSLVLLLMALPVTLLAMAWPGKEGATNDLGKKLLRLTLSMFVVKTLFVFMITALLQIMYLTELLLAQFPIGDIFLSALVPLFAFYVVRRIGRLVGLGDMLTMSGAVGFTAAAATKASGAPAEALATPGLGAAGGRTLGGNMKRLGANHMKHRRQNKHWRSQKKRDKALLGAIGKDDAPGAGLEGGVDGGVDPHTREGRKEINDALHSGLDAEHGAARQQETLLGNRAIAIDALDGKVPQADSAGVLLAQSAQAKLAAQSMGTADMQALRDEQKSRAGGPDPMSSADFHRRGHDIAEQTHKRIQTIEEVAQEASVTLKDTALSQIEVNATLSGALDDISATIGGSGKAMAPSSGVFAMGAAAAPKPDFLPPPKPVPARGHEVVASGGGGGGGGVHKQKRASRSGNKAAVS